MYNFKKEKEVKCNRCKIYKPITDFKVYKGVLRKSCLLCKRKRSQEYYNKKNNILEEHKLDIIIKEYNAYFNS